MPPASSSPTPRTRAAAALARPAPAESAAEVVQEARPEAGRQPSAETGPDADGRTVRIPKQDRSRRTRRRILEAAIRCFEARGYDETPTAAIAQEAGIAVGTLYGYFRDKRDILLELADQTISEVSKYVVDNLAPQSLAGRDPRQITREVIDTIFHTQKLRPGMQRIMWERFFKDPEFRAPVEAIHARTVAAVRGFLDALAARGELRAMDRDTVATVIVNAVQWNATRAFMDGDPEAIERITATTTALVSHFLFPEE